MSIEYFVEGKIKIQTEGNNLLLSKKNIVYNSKNIIQKGNNLGVTHNDPKTVEENNNPSKSIDVTLNLFFDGTFNNKNNTDARVLEGVNKGSSYDNEYSNIAKGYNAVDANADKQVKIYIEGIGTVDEKKDESTGGGLGTGERGIKAKATKGCIQGAEAVYRKFKKKPIDTLYVNVYGFSRGAAAARHFLHVASTPATVAKTGKKRYAIEPNRFEANKEEQKNYITQRIEVKQPNHPLLIKNGYFGACLLAKELNIQNVIFNFIGLYDTVASYGVNHRGNRFVKNDAEQLNLRAANQGAFVFQIAADNEFRENFSLTNINASGKKGLQITLPGSHSDIGGGYANNSTEKVLIYSSAKKSLCENYKNILIAEGWYNKEQLLIQEINTTAGRSSHYVYQLWGTRTLFNHYDKISLLYMTDYATLFNVKHLDDIVKENTIMDKNLKSIYSQLDKYVAACINLRKQCIQNRTSDTNYINQLQALHYTQFYSNNAELKKLRNQYLHWSANLNEFFMGPRLSGVLPINKRTRTIFNG